MGSEQSSVTAPRGVSAPLWQRLKSTVDSLGSVGVVRVLDCGGGSGSIAVPLAQLGAEVTVVDVSIDALGTLTRRASEAGVADRVHAVQGEAESLSELLPAGAFDLVLAHEVLADVSNVSAAVTQLASMARTGGIVSIVVGNPVAVVLGRALSGDVAGALASWQRGVGSSLDVASLSEAATSAGLHVEQVNGIGVFTELVPGIDLERPGAMTALAELEAIAAGVSPYRDIASRLHVLARKPDLPTGTV